MLGADELLPAVSWLVLQANPPNVDASLWYASEFRYDIERYCKVASLERMSWMMNYLLENNILF